MQRVCATSSCFLLPNSFVNRPVAFGVDTRRVVEQGQRRPGYVESSAARSWGDSVAHPGTRAKDGMAIWKSTGRWHWLTVKRSHPCVCAGQEFPSGSARNIGATFLQASTHDPEAAQAHSEAT